MLQTTKELLNKIDEELDKRNLSMYSLVRECVLTAGEYRYLMKGKNIADYSPRLEVLLKICKYFGITLNDLLPRYNRSKKSDQPYYIRDFIKALDEIPYEYRDLTIKCIESYKMAKAGKYANANVFGDKNPDDIGIDFLLAQFLEEDEDK